MILKKKSKVIISEPTTFPTGVVVKTEKGFFFVKGSFRLKIPTDNVLASWSFPRFIDASETALGKTPVAGKLGFRDGTILLDISDHTYHLVSGQKTRHITNPEVLRRLNATTNDAIVVSHAEVALHKVGEEID